MSSDAFEAAVVPVHLLFVDDDRLILSTLSQELCRSGYEVTVAESMAEALDLLIGGVRPDLAILDVRMDHGDGLELAQHLSVCYRLPFVMLSAYSDTETVQRAAKVGALGYLVKPVSAQQIIPTLEAALRRSQEIQGLTNSSLQLKQALDNERSVCVAVGLTMAQSGLGRQAALELMRQSARKQRCKLADFAQNLICAAEAASKQAS